MSRLSVYHEHLPGHPDKVLCHAEDIASTLVPYSVVYEAATPQSGLSLDSSLEQVELPALLATLPQRQLLSAPAAPEARAEARAAWLEERCCEAELGYAQLRGRALLTLHIGEQVLELLLEPGERVRLPAGCKHWLDWGEEPRALLLRAAETAAEDRLSSDPLPAHFSRLEDC